MKKENSVLRQQDLYIGNKGEWPEEFMETVLLPIPKKNNAKKCKEFRTISLISHTANIIQTILNQLLRSKMGEELERNSLASGMETVREMQLD